jgi:hypothetical protein
MKNQPSRLVFYTSIPNAPLTKSPIAKEIKATPKLIALIWKKRFLNDKSFATEI